jgi:hypothetical protein
MILFVCCSAQSLFEMQEIPDVVTVCLRHPGYGSEMMSSPG